MSLDVAAPAPSGQHPTGQQPVEQEPLSPALAAAAAADALDGVGAATSTPSTTPIVVGHVPTPIRRDAPPRAERRASGRLVLALLITAAVLAAGVGALAFVSWWQSNQAGTATVQAADGAQPPAAPNGAPAAGATPNGTTPNGVTPNGATPNGAAMPQQPVDTDVADATESFLGTLAVDQRSAFYDAVGLTAEGEIDGEIAAQALVENAGRIGAIVEGLDDTQLAAFQHLLQVAFTSTTIDAPDASGAPQPGSAGSQGTLPSGTPVGSQG